MNLLHSVTFLLSPRLNTLMNALHITSTLPSARIGQRERVPCISSAAVQARVHTASYTECLLACHASAMEGNMAKPTSWLKTLLIKQ